MGRSIHQPRHVLVVEDDEDIRESIQLLLEEHGYIVTKAAHGKEAWDALERGLKPDVILLDLNMPVMNGWEVCDRLQSSAHAKTPVIVVTAGMDKPPLEAPVLRKPVRMDVLLDVIHQAATP